MYRGFVRQGGAERKHYNVSSEDCICSTSLDFGNDIDTILNSASHPLSFNSPHWQDTPFDYNMREDRQFPNDTSFVSSSIPIKATTSSMASAYISLPYWSYQSHREESPVDTESSLSTCGFPAAAYNLDLSLGDRGFRSYDQPETHYESSETPRSPLSIGFKSMTSWVESNQNECSTEMRPLHFLNSDREHEEIYADPSTARITAATLHGECQAPCSSSSGDTSSHKRPATEPHPCHESSDPDYGLKRSRLPNKSLRTRTKSNLIAHQKPKNKLTKYTSSWSLTEAEKPLRISLPSKPNTAKKPPPTTSSSKPRPFICPLQCYGCPSTFPSKNEWKRHVNTVHLRLGYWHCDLCEDQVERPNNFNRKDLFTQHLRRIHFDARNELKSTDVKGAVKQRTRNTKPSSTPARGRGKSEEKVGGELDEIHVRCWVRVRDSPSEATCAVCRASFHGASAVEDWLEHTSRHLSAGPNIQQMSDGNSMDTAESVHWLRDAGLRRWLLCEGTSESCDGGSSFRLPSKETGKHAEC